MLWVPHGFAETALNMNAACNNIIGAVYDPEQLDQILNAAEKQLDSYGVFSKTKGEDQISNRFLSDEIRGLGISARIIPTIFLGIASMILLVLLNRMVRKERTEIGLLKAYGYTNLAVAWHYLKFALVLAVAGCAGSFFVGQWLAKEIVGIYVQFYQFPVLRAQVYPEVVARSFGMAMAAAVLGALMAAWHAARIDPRGIDAPRGPALRAPGVVRAIHGSVAPVLVHVEDDRAKRVAQQVSRGAERVRGDGVGRAYHHGILHD